MIWELIRANKRKSIILMFTMSVVLVGLGALLGMLFGGTQGGIFGIAIAVVIFFILISVSFSSGDKILLASCKAKPITKQMHPQLFNVVEEMTIAASLPKMPNIYIIPEESPNAFATGRNPENASVAVTAGLLARLNRDELQGVIAHEISHIIHRDILYITLAGIMLGSIVLISDVVLRSMFYSSAFGSRRYSSRSRNSDGGLVIIIALIAAILAPIIAQVIYFSLSRRREYLADAGAARLTRYPEGLANALAKISSSSRPMQTANKVTAPMYIAPPVATEKMSFAGLGHTHPPIQERIKILNNMTHGASLKDYSNAFSAITGSKSSMPNSVLNDNENIQIREADNKQQKTKSQKKQLREIGDIIRTVNGFAFLTCTCGLKMKVPPNFNSTKVKCPRCGKVNSVA